MSYRSMRLRNNITDEKAKNGRGGRPPRELTFRLKPRNRKGRIARGG